MRFLKLQIGVFHELLGTFFYNRDGNTDEVAQDSMPLILIRMMMHIPQNSNSTWPMA